MRGGGPAQLLGTVPLYRGILQVFSAHRLLSVKARWQQTDDSRPSHGELEILPIVLGYVARTQGTRTTVAMHGIETGVGGYVGADGWHTSSARVFQPK